MVMEARRVEEDVVMLQQLLSVPTLPQAIAASSRAPTRTHLEVPLQQLGDLVRRFLGLL